MGATPDLAIAQSSEQPMKTYIGVLDMKKIMSDLDVVQDLNAQAKKIEDARQEGFKAQEKSLQEEKRKIEQQKALLTAEAYSNKQIAFNKKVAAYRLDQQEAMRNIQAGRIDALNKIREQMLPVVRQIMNEHGASFVLDIREVLFVEKEINLTDEVIGALNKKLKKVKFDTAPQKKN